MNNKTKNIILVTILVLVFFAGSWLYVRKGALEKASPPACTQEAKICPDGSAVSRTGPLCEFAACPESAGLPNGYTLDSFTVEKNLNISCVKNSDCQTPPEYLMISRCPMATLCLKSQCTVVCPNYAGGK